MNGIHLQGVLPPMITPFRANGNVDFDAFVRNVHRWNSAPLAGYLVLGSNSEASYLSEEEKLELISLTAKEAKPGRFLMAGTGMESTRETIRFTDKAAARGIHAALVLTPCYYGAQMSDEALITHFTAVADVSSIPILIYNVPKFTHVNIRIEAIRVLCNHPNIVGMKDSAGDPAQLEKFQTISRQGFQVLAGNASVWLDALSIGIEGGILALSNCVPDLCAGIQEFHRGGEHERSAQLHTRLLPLNQAVTATYGIAGLKFACDLLGYDGGDVRSPLMPLSVQGQKEIRSILAIAGLIPAG